MSKIEKFPKVPGTASVSCLLTWLGTKGDYASLERRDGLLKGWRRYFSAVTREGRASIVLATYTVTAVAGYMAWRHYTQKQKARRSNINTVSTGES